MADELLPTVDPRELAAAAPTALDPDALDVARTIVDDVRARGLAAVREHAERLGDLEPGAPLVIARSQLERELEGLDAADRGVLERTAERIRSFAVAQRDALQELEREVPGGRAGHRVAPVECAGCYAPGGRYPLPSSVLMTAVTARAAGVGSVQVASPRPSAVTLAAAAVAGADALLACGGAQGIAAFAFGAGEEIPRCDVIAGPGNRYVTAAKQLVSDSVGIDMLAGPSELVVLADASADPTTVAADLIAQAEHDEHARPILIAVDAPALIDAVRAELETQLASLPTAATARIALARGAAAPVPDIDTGIALCDHLAPEHLEVLCEDADGIADRLSHYGGLFVGFVSAEVFGDYGVGPNHVLPTGGTARFSGGLSVFTFLRVRTWLRLDTSDPALRSDVARLAELEGLAGHAAAARLRGQR